MSVHRTIFPIPHNTNYTHTNTQTSPLHYMEIERGIPCVNAAAILCTAEMLLFNNKHLIILLSLGGLGCQVPAVASMLINLVGDGDLVQVGKDVLHLGISVRALVASKIV